MVLGRAYIQVLAGLRVRHKRAETQHPAGPPGCFQPTMGAALMSPVG